MLTVDSKDFQFRNTVKQVMGIDLSQPGQRLEFAAFQAALEAGLFEGKLGPEKRKNDAGELEETGFTKCFKLTGQVGTRPEDAPAADTDSPLIGMPSETDDAAGDDEIPF